MPDVRMPTQKRSIEKRNKIIEKGFELMCENGYYNTNTQQIADYAGVSTGIIYQYFNDKKDIFIEGVKNYSEGIMFPLLNILEKETISNKNLEAIIKDLLNKYIKAHTISKRAHEELLAMSHLDSDVGNVFKENEIISTNKIVELLESSGLKLKNSKEKIHLIINIMDDICHEIVYHQHSEIDYDIMLNEVINVIVNILK